MTFIPKRSCPMPRDEVVLDLAAAIIKSDANRLAAIRAAVVAMIEVCDDTLNVIPDLVPDAIIEWSTIRADFQAIHDRLARDDDV